MKNTDRTHYRYEIPGEPERTSKTVKVAVDEIWDEDRFVVFVLGLVLDIDSNTFFYAPVTDEQWDAKPYPKTEFDDLWERAFEPAIGGKAMSVRLTADEYRRVARHHVDADILANLALEIAG